MATQAVSAVAGIAPQQAAPAQSAKASGFASGGVRVPRVAGLAKGSARVKHVTRASATPRIRLGEVRSTLGIIAMGDRDHWQGIVDDAEARGQKPPADAVAKRDAAQTKAVDWLEGANREYEFYLRYLASTQPINSVYMKLSANYELLRNYAAAEQMIRSYLERESNIDREGRTALERRARGLRQRRLDELPVHGPNSGVGIAKDGKDRVEGQGQDGRTSIQAEPRDGDGDGQERQARDRLENAGHPEADALPSRPSLHEDSEGYPHRRGQAHREQGQNHVLEEPPTRARPGGARVGAIDPSTGVRLQPGPSEGGEELARDLGRRTPLNLHRMVEAGHLRVIQGACQSLQDGASLGMASQGIAAYERYGLVGWKEAQVVLQEDQVVAGEPAVRRVHIDDVQLARVADTSPKMFQYLRLCQPRHRPAQASSGTHAARLRAVAPPGDETASAAPSRPVDPFAAAASTGQSSPEPSSTGPRAAAPGAASAGSGAASAGSVAASAEGSDIEAFEFSFVDDDE